LDYLSAAGFWTPYHFAAVFFLCGLCTGAYFPIAARQLADSGLRRVFPAENSKQRPHRGRAGSLATGLVLIPVLGTRERFGFFLP